MDQERWRRKSEEVVNWQNLKIEEHKAKYIRELGKLCILIGEKEIGDIVSNLLGKMCRGILEAERNMGGTK